jgi:hypothetical protein
MAFFITFIVVVAAGQLLGTWLATFPVGEIIMDNGFTTTRPLPDSQEWYLAYDNFHFDHYTLYHGTNESIQYAREADVLLLGNSRMQLAFPHTLLMRAARETGFKFYNLAFGYNETSTFALSLIEKQNLRPRIVVANAGAFFSPWASEFGEKVMKSSRWETWRTVWEQSLASRLRHSSLFEWLPAWWELSPGDLTVWYMILYRAVPSGSWFAYRERLMHIPIGTPPEAISERPDTVDRQTLSIARDFKRELAERGTYLVLTWIPYPGQWHERRDVAALADILEVPFISPVVAGLFTRDGYHLNDESAERFSAQFLADFNTWLKESGTTNRP